MPARMLVRPDLPASEVKRAWPAISSGAVRFSDE